MYIIKARLTETLEVTDVETPFLFVSLNDGRNAFLECVIAAVSEWRSMKTDEAFQSFCMMVDEHHPSLSTSFKKPRACDLDGLCMPYIHTKAMEVPINIRDVYYYMPSDIMRKHGFDKYKQPKADLTLHFDSDCESF